jgi:hypothetical protein
MLLEARLTASQILTRFDRLQLVIPDIESCGRLLLPSEKATPQHARIAKSTNIFYGMSVAPALLS